MDENQRALISAVLPPLITAGLAALSLWITERRKDRNAAQRMRKAVAEENDHIAYLKSWLETELLVGDADGADASKAREEVRKQLAESRTRLARAEPGPTQEAAPSPKLRALKKAALVPLSRPAARIVRLGYWFVLTFGLLLLLFAMTTDYTEVQAIDVSLSDVFFFSVMLTSPFLVVALLLAYWAHALESRQRQNLSTTSSGVARPVTSSQLGRAQSDALPRPTQPPEATPLTSNDPRRTYQ